MEGLYKNKYKIESARLKNYNYSQRGYYFITICTANRFYYFGNIKKGKMILNENGKIVHQELSKTPGIRKNIILDEFIIMPNHIHFILIIGTPLKINGKIVLETKLLNNPDPIYIATGRTDALNASPVQNNINKISSLIGGAYNAPLRTNKPYQNKFGPQRNNLASIIRGLKSTTNRQINELAKNKNFAWQPRFWDHIIRNEKSLYNIRHYIRDNPAKWYRDSNNPDGLLM